MYYRRVKRQKKGVSRLTPKHFYAICHHVCRGVHHQDHLLVRHLVSRHGCPPYPCASCLGEALDHCGDVDPSYGALEHPCRSDNHPLEEGDSHQDCGTHHHPRGAYSHLPRPSWAYPLLLRMHHLPLPNLVIQLITQGLKTSSSS